MGFLDNVKVLAEKTAKVAKKTAVATQNAYKEGGLEAVGFQAGKLTKDAVNNVVAYSEEVSKEAKKAAKPAGIAFTKDQPTAKAAAKLALGVIAGMRKVGLDASDKISNATDEFQKLSQPKNKF